MSSSAGMVADKSGKRYEQEQDVSAKVKAGRVWIDLDNSPHVPFFAPIIRELEKQGHSVLLTARDAFQVRELLDLHGLQCKCIGSHYGKNRIMKMLGLAVRAIQLLPSVITKRPDLAVGHGARSQLALATLLRIPTLHIGDYEHAKTWAIIHPSWVLIPDVIPSGAIDEQSNRILRYPGIKEDVYVPGFVPDPAIREQLGLTADDLVVTLRPPASEAHYHSPKSDELFHASMELLGQHPGVKVVMLPRNDRQEAFVRQTWQSLFAEGKVMIPDRVVDGLNLIWFSDLVISGGGTMNREAAALGVPVYSIFRGKTGAVDKYLSATGRLMMLESAEDVRSRIRLVHRDRTSCAAQSSMPALQTIVSHIVSILNGTVKTAQ